ncbi:unnamed protein product [Caenorhabditis brenneri]
MRIGNTTEREAPWKLEFSLDRLKPRNWKRPYLVYLHLVLKLLPWCVLLFGAPGVSYIGKSEGYLMATMKTEINAACFTFLALLDFFITKNVLGSKLTGLHHGFKKDEESNKITYHYYAEKDFLTRYPATDRDTFFTVMVFFSLFWIITAVATLLTFNISLILSSILGLTSVYLNLYLFVQVRYYRQWTMSKFIASWAYNFFVRIEFLDDESSGNNFRNTYYDNRAKY